MYLKFFYLNVFELFTSPSNSFRLGTCVACRGNKYLNGDKTGCEVCESGKVINEVRNGCDDCPAGTAGTNGTCNPCPSGKFQDDTGKTTCKDCPNGKFQDDTGKTTCKDCPSGKKPSGDKRTCVPCDAGTTGINCVTKCEGNKYSKAGDANCRQCGPGQKRNHNGTGCVDCPAGTAGTDGYCRSCNTGKQYSGAGESSCSYCDSNQKPKPGRDGCISKVYNWFYNDLIEYEHGGFNESSWRNNAWMEVTHPTNKELYIVIIKNQKAVYAGRKNGRTEIILSGAGTWRERFVRDENTGLDDDDISFGHFSESKHIDDIFTQESIATFQVTSFTNHNRESWSGKGQAYSFRYSYGIYDFP